MTEAKNQARLSTRDAVETAIELTKQDKQASWDDLAIRKRKHGVDSVERPSGRRLQRSTAKVATGELT